MERFIQGDQEAFRGLFTRYATPLRRALLRMSGSPSQADDLLQITFMSVVRGRGRFQAGRRVRPWLFAVALNAARDMKRRTRNERPSDDGELPLTELVTPQTSDPGLQRRISQALGELSQPLREAVVLHHFENLSFSEIAEVAGCSQSAAKVRAHRGYERLRALLEDVR